MKIIRPTGEHARTDELTDAELLELARRIYDEPPPPQPFRGREFEGYLAEQQAAWQRLK